MSTNNALLCCLLEAWILKRNKNTINHININISDDIFWNIFLLFPQIRTWHISLEFAWKYQTLFSGKSKANTFIINLSSAEFVQRVAYGYHSFQEDIFFLPKYYHIVTPYYIAQDKRSTQLFFLLLHVCCEYSLEAPPWGASNEYPQHMFSWRNNKIWILSR